MITRPISPLTGLRFIGVLLMALTACPGTARAAFTFDYIDGGYATGISADGHVVVGNTPGDFETFRWTPVDGLVRLGRSTVPVLGTGAGAPGVSADGLRVSATILGADSTYSTQGRWTAGVGWQELMPPTLPDGGLTDQSYGSAWAISGDGDAVVGLYWRPGAPGGSAHASHWTQASGLADLGSSGRSSRASGVDFDGNVVVGFDEHPTTGVRRAAAWESGVLTIIDPAPDGVSEAVGVNPAGTRIVGRSYDPGRTYTVATIWRKIGGSWSLQRLGALPGTMLPSGLSIANDVSADGNVVVGYNRFSGPFNATGFIWTQATGLVDMVDYLASHGITLTNFDLLNMTAISDDGKTMVGYGQTTIAPFVVRSFIIRTDAATSVDDAPATWSSPGLHVSPNPTSAGATIAFDMAVSTDATVEVFDVQGRSVRRLLEGLVAEGTHEVRWDGRERNGSAVASGLYYVRLTERGRTTTHRLVVTR